MGRLLFCQEKEQSAEVFSSNSPDLFVLILQQSNNHRDNLAKRLLAHQLTVGSLGVGEDLGQENDNIPAEISPRTGEIREGGCDCRGVHLYDGSTPRGEDVNLVKQTSTDLPAGHNGAHQSWEAVTGIVRGEAGYERLEPGSPGCTLQSLQTGQSGGLVL